MALMKQNVIYLLNPRTASRATRLAMLEQLDFKELPGGHHADLDLIQVAPVARMEYLTSTLVEWCSKILWTVCQTVRHPCDVLSSEYHMSEGLRKKFPTILDWLQSPLQNGSLEGIYSNHRNKKRRTHQDLFYSECNCIFRYEDLQAELNKMWPHLRLHHDQRHTTKDKPDWRDEWGPLERAWAKKHLQDLERYQYAV